MASESDETVRVPPERRYPPLDTVESRWWYWIVAYLVGAVLLVPLIVITAFAFLAPAIIIGSGNGPVVGAPLGVFLILFLLLVFGFTVLAFAIFVMLPIALYMDARAVGQAGVGWKPDPMIYGVLGLLQFVVTPLVGVIVALYYLYRRHEHVGVP